MTLLKRMVAFIKYVQSCVGAKIYIWKVVQYVVSWLLQVRHGLWYHSVFVVSKGQLPLWNRRLFTVYPIEEYNIPLNAVITWLIQYTFYDTIMYAYPSLLARIG